MIRFLKGLGIGLGIAGLFAAAMYFAPDGATFWIIAITPMALIAGLLGFSLPYDNLVRWSKSHAVPITSENREVIVRHLTRGRRIRTVGAVLGYVGYTAFTIEIANDEASWGVLRSIFFGYLIGAGVAEVWALRLRPHGTAAASLTPRTVHDYLPRPAIYLLRAVPVAIVILSAFWEWIPEDRTFNPGEATPGLGWIVMWAGIALGVAVFVEVVIRKIVRRPQPVVSEEMLRVDDAIRSTSIHQLAGAGLALMLGILAARIGDLNMGPGWHNVAIGMTGMFSGIGSIFAWFHLGVDQPWVVRRSLPAKVAA